MPSGLAWDASRSTVPEHQCEVHIVGYIYRGPLNLRIWEEREPVSQKLISIGNYIDNYEQTRTIWMDDSSASPRGRAAAYSGWDFPRENGVGDILTVYTTHIKQGWLRRDGLRRSDQATLVEHFIRHGDHMIHASIVTDPLTLSEPLIKTQDFNLRVQNGQTWLYPCEPVVEIPRPRGAVPHYLPGEKSIYPRVCRQIQDSRGGGPGWRGDHVSGVPVEIDEDGCGPGFRERQMTRRSLPAERRSIPRDVLRGDGERAGNRRISRRSRCKATCIYCRAAAATSSCR